MLHLIVIAACWLCAGAETVGRTDGAHDLPGQAHDLPVAWDSGAGRQLQDKPKYSSPAEARAGPVTVAVKTSHYFGRYDRVVPNCTHTDGLPMECVYVEAGHSLATGADAVWYHAPSSCGAHVPRESPNQLTVVMSMEASTYYSCLDDIKYMDQFDIEMTYRRCSHVQVPYFAEVDSEIQNRVFADPEPFESKHDAIVYINSNCGALNGRNDIVGAMMKLGKLPVDAWGQCLRNKVPPNHESWTKVQVFRKYKFCIAMENSNTMDYVTEKVWHALESGCLPIYYGAPNIEDYVPTPNSIIDYRKYGTHEKLMDYLVTLSKDKAAYQATQKWRYTPLDQLSPGFRKMIATHGSPQVHTQCQLCQLIMKRRLDPTVNFTHTHCLRNQTWLDAVKNGGSSWGPGSDDLLSIPHASRWSPAGVWDPLHEADMDKPRSAPDAFTGLPGGGGRWGRRLQGQAQGDSLGLGRPWNTTNHPTGSGSQNTWQTQQTFSRSNGPAWDRLEVQPIETEAEQRLAMVDSADGSGGPAVTAGGYNRRLQSRGMDIQETSRKRPKAVLSREKIHARSPTLRTPRGNQRQKSAIFPGQAAALDASPVEAGKLQGREDARQARGWEETGSMQGRKDARQGRGRDEGGHVHGREGSKGTTQWGRAAARAYRPALEGLQRSLQRGVDYLSTLVVKKKSARNRRQQRNQ